MLRFKDRNLMEQNLTRCIAIRCLLRYVSLGIPCDLMSRWFNCHERRAKTKGTLAESANTRNGRQRLGEPLQTCPEALATAIFDMKQVEERFGILKCLASRSAFRNRRGVPMIFPRFMQYNSFLLFTRSSVVSLNGVNVLNNLAACF